VRRSVLALIAVTAATWLLADAPSDGPAAPGEADGVTVLFSKEHDGVFPDCEPETADGQRLAWTATIVVDAITGLPIEGVRVSAHIEPHCAIPDRWEPERTVKTGADGWARMPLEDLPDGDIDWWFYIADGYAPYAHFSTLMEFPIRLRKGVNVPIEVRDHLERPIADVKVGLILGCGHTPNVRRATTDADGRAVLPNVTPGKGELWPLKLGFEADYVDLDAWRPGWPPMVARIEPGMTLVGQVTDHLSRPLANAFVGAPGCHRGPWTRADDQGRFQLAGADFGSNIYVRAADGEFADHEVVISGPVASGLFRVIRSTQDPDDVDELIGRKLGVQIDLFSEGQPVDAASARLVRDSDGMTFSGVADSEGLVRLKCPTGRYRVFTRSPSGLEAWAEHETPFVVRKGGERQRIAMVPLQSVRFALDGWKAPRYSSVELVGEEGLIEMETGAPMTIPKGFPLRVRIGLAGRSPTFVDVRPDARGRCAVPAVPTRRITIALRSPDGEPSLGWVTVLTRERQAPPSTSDTEEGASAGHTVEVETGQDLIAYAVPKDPKLAAVAVALILPAPPANAVTIVFDRRAPVLTVEPPTWANDAHPELLVRHDGFTEEAIGTRIRDGFLAIPKGAQVRATLADGPPRAINLDGDGPWTLAWPATPLIVNANTTDGQPIPRFEVFIGDQQWIGTNGVATIRGLTLGKHTVHVAAETRRSRTLEIRIDDEEGGAFTTVLGPRR